MADIDVVKKRSNTWIWVVVAVALLVVLWAVFGSRSNARAHALSGSAWQVADAPHHAPAFDRAPAYADVG